MKGKVKPEAYYHKNVIVDTLKEVAQEHNLYFDSQPKELNGGNEWDNIHVVLRGKNMLGLGFMVQQMPGCCAILTMSHLRTFNQETFDRTVAFVEDAAFRAGFGSMVLTQVWNPKEGYKREPWALLLKPERGWEISEPFINAKSGNHVSYLTKNLGHRGKVAGLEEPCYEVQRLPFGF